MIGKHFAPHLSAILVLEEIAGMAIVHDREMNYRRVHRRNQQFTQLAVPQVVLTGTRYDVDHRRSSDKRAEARVPSISGYIIQRSPRQHLFRNKLMDVLAGEVCMAKMPTPNQGHSLIVHRHEHRLYAVFQKPRQSVARVESRGKRKDIGYFLRRELFDVSPYLLEGSEKTDRHERFD
jgi:hypothetical protein